MKQHNLETGLLYLSFHNSIKKIYGVNRIVNERDLIIKLGRQFLVPKNLRVLAIKELERMGLLKRITKNSVKIIDYKLNVEEDANKFLKKMHLFSIL